MESSSFIGAGFIAHNGHGFAMGWYSTTPQPKPSADYRFKVENMKKS